MRPPQFRFIPFEDNLLQRVADECDSSATLLVFPTETSRQAAQKMLQDRWQLQNRQFLTMEELQSRLFIAPAPLLKEEKRTLAFYASLAEQNRSFFEIHSYARSIDLANKFFTLWEEFRQERVDENEIVPHLAAHGVEWQDWQARTFDRLLSIRDDYHAFITARGFSDSIFILKDEFFNLHHIAGMERVVFVNQVHYTRLERDIIKELGQSGREVAVYYQLPEALVDKDRLTIRPFGFRDILPGRLSSLTVHACHNSFTQYSALIELMHTGSLQEIVDVKRHRDAFVQFLSPGRFDLGTAKSMMDTSVFNFFTAIWVLLQDLIHDQKRNKMLLPVPSLIQAIKCREVILHFLPEVGTEADTHQARLLSRLDEMLQAHVHYIDLDLQLAQVFPRFAHEPLMDLAPLVRFLAKIAAIEHVRDLCQLVDEPEGFLLDRIIKDGERTCSDLRDVFYRLLADFAVLEEQGLAGDWSDFFPIHLPHARAQGILRLFLDYMKPNRIQISMARFEVPRPLLTALMDTRNLSYEKLAILNLSEGQLPSKQEMQYLLTEKQRAALGLKVYEEVRTWEKYHFARLVLTTPDVHLFTIKDEERNVEISSFVEELIIDLPEEKIIRSGIDDSGYRQVYRNWLDSDSALMLKYTAGPGWGMMPCEPAEDFPDGRLKLAPTIFSRMKKSPFEFCLRDIGHIPQRVEKMRGILDEALLGVFAHELLSRIWGLYLQDELRLPLSRIYEQYGGRAEQELLRDQSGYYYKIPQNHERIFFEKILLPKLQAGCATFFKRAEWLVNRLQGPLAIFPESNRSAGAARDEIPLIPANENAMNLLVTLYGRSDLRLVRGTPAEYFIFDYKTGMFDRDQLLFYELYYYLLADGQLADRVESFFYLLLTDRMVSAFDAKKTSKQEAIQALIVRVKKVLQEIREQGYATAADKPKEKKVQDIFRHSLIET